MDTKTPKGRRRLLIVGALVLAGVLILVYLSKNNGSSSDQQNKPTAVEFSSSWNSSNTWANPSGNPWHRQQTMPPVGGRRGPWNPRDRILPPFRWDTDHDKKIFQGRK